MDGARMVTAITGGSRGIGAAIARRLAAEGHDLVIGYHRDRAAAEAVVADVAHRGASAVAASVDVTDADSVEGFFDAAGEVGSLTTRRRRPA